MQNRVNIRNSETFIVRIYGQENATWQGEIHWIDKQKKQNFRSMLELMKLIDGALEIKKNDKEDGNEKA